MARRSFIAVVAAVVVLVAAPRAARAEALMFHLTVGDVLDSVGRTNAFLVSLGRQAHGLKLVPGGTRFAGLTCAGFGDVYKLASVRILDGPGALLDLVATKRGRDARALATVFQTAGVTTWAPPATDAETDRQLWSAGAVPHGLRFVSDALASGGDGGLLDASANAGVFRFRADVPVSPVPGVVTHRFLLELIGRTASTDAALVAFGEQRCFTFVDLVSVDASVLQRLVDALDDAYVRNGLAIRVQTLQAAIANRDYVTALEVLAYIAGHLIARSPEHAEPAAARRVVAGVFDVRRGLDFRAATSQCGNGTRETGEACDGADLGGFTCETVGYQSGTLGCQPSCLFSYDACVANPVCGNGILEPSVDPNHTEECDDGAQNSDVLPDACRTNCKRSSCGDGVIDTFEDCEGSNLDGQTCQTLGYARGTLRCDPDYCFFDDARCDDEGDF